MNTTWLYPIEDIQKALLTTNEPHTFDGTHIVCPDMQSFIGLYLDIFAQTAISQPVGNPGYSLGVGSMLEDLGDQIQFILASGQVVLVWRRVRQLTPQLPYTVISSPGNSPPDTIGYITVWASYGKTPPNSDLDVALVARIG